MHTTNYVDSFITIAPDCPVDHGVVPPERANPSVAARMFDLIDSSPYQLTSDDVIFTVHADRAGIPKAGRPKARAAFFAEPRACLRSSDLGKRYGWGIHSDSGGLVALYSCDSDTYAALENGEDPKNSSVAVATLTAMRSSRQG